MNPMAGEEHRPKSLRNERPASTRHVGDIIWKDKAQTSGVRIVRDAFTEMLREKRRTAIAAVWVKAALPKSSAVFTFPGPARLPFTAKWMVIRVVVKGVAPRR
jgi:hypothetical protein